MKCLQSDWSFSMLTLNCLEFFWYMFHLAPD